MAAQQDGAGRGAAVVRRPADLAVGVPRRASRWASTALASFAEAAYDGDDPLAVPEAARDPMTITRTDTGAVLRIALPFAQRQDVDLARHGDELVVTVGSYRRLLALPGGAEPPHRDGRARRGRRPAGTVPVRAGGAAVTTRGDGAPARRRATRRAVRAAGAGRERRRGGRQAARRALGLGHATRAPTTPARRPARPSAFAHAVHDVNEHIATGSEDCRYCPVCQVIHVVRADQPGGARRTSSWRPAR